ncbi:oligosaccharyl transferase delta subunit [Pluteus cervinus]|uniref:Oligosaccharyl transferase delta subunit n=1 Tax=Pluteus cervinus TaxID=181527 RepID=A0ACD3B718_9AGAR|nr:oligosaccharyl transferase delta subunit [Pluteus cervinus]
MRCLFSLLLLAASARAAILTLQSARFIITDAKGEQVRSEPISTTHAAKPIELGKSDTLKLTFQVFDKEEGQGVQPHQTFLRFYDEVSGEEGLQPVRVASNGKAKFELNLAKPPLSLPPTKADTPLKLSLIIGAPSHSPLTVKLPDLLLPASQAPPVHPDEASFHPLPEIHHTFRPDQKLPPRPISAVFTAVVLAPWVVLLGLWSQVSIRVPYIFSPSILPFIATLGAFEGLLFAYWVDLKLGQVLFYGAGLSLATIFTGKNALAAIGSRRTGKGN